MKIKNFFFLIASFLLFSSCSHIDVASSNVSDIRSNLSYRSITNQGYMGGSLPYFSEELSSSPLRNNAIVAIRLGKVNRIDVDGEQSFFQDKSDEAVYGFIKINSITDKNINFDFQYYDKQEKLAKEQNFLISKDQKLDINGDGLEDLKYYESKGKRLGISNIMYLEFVSSQLYEYTTMFAVLKEQYSNEDYPGGIIGINPNGAYILSKYTTDSSRSVLRTFKSGDYVVDSLNGKYQRINAIGFYGSSRSVYENELEYIEEDLEAVVLKFYEEEFIGEYNADVLLQNVCEFLKIEKGTEETSIENLNQILLRKDLLEKILEKNIFEEDKELNEILQEIETYTENEIAQLNRSLIELIFQDICPKSIESSNVFTEILPLASAVFGNREGNTNAQVRASSREVINATSLDTYEQHKKELEDKYDKYFEIIKLKLSIPDGIKTNYGTIDITINNSYIAWGVKGSFNSSWGSVKASFKTCVYLTADTNISTKVSYNKKLYEFEKSLYKTTIPIYGPIVINISFKINLSVPLKINHSVSERLQYSAAFVGLYEGGFNVGVDYGIKWKKKWFIRYPKPYMDWNGRNTSEDHTLCFATIDGDNLGELKGSSITIGIDGSAILEFDISKVVGGDVSVGSFVYSQLSIEPKDNHLLVISRTVPEVYMSAGVFLGIKDLPIIGDIGHRWPFDIFKNNLAVLEKELFRIK